MALEYGDYTHIAEVLSMENADIEELEYPSSSDADAELIPLSRPKKNLLKVFKAYHTFMKAQGTPVNFLVITKEEFDEFRINIYAPSSLMSQFSSIKINDNAKSTQSTGRFNQVDDFRRGIKKDKDHYTVLKEDKQWDS